MNYIKYFLIFIKENLFFAIFSGGLIYIILPIWKETKNDINDIEDYLLAISSLENIITGALYLLIVTIIIFRLNISKFCRDNVAKYKPNKEIIDATERNQIKTKNTIYIWLKNIYILIDDYNKTSKLIYKIFKPIYMGRVYCEWLIGFFKFTILGRWIAAIFAIYLVFGTYIQQSHQQRLATFSNTLSTFSNTVAQAEAFLHDKYPTEDSISNDKEQLYYYSSATDLKGALEFLHKNGRDLDYLYLPRSQLSRIQLFPKASLEGAVFSGSDLRNSNLSIAQLEEAKLIGTNLRKADLTGANLYKADLSGAKLRIADLTGADLYKADLTGADLYKADLIGADLYKADLTRANLRRADLTRANLEKANLSGANLEKANLSGADLRRAIITDADFTGAENLTKEQIMKACWLRAGTYRVKRKKIVIKDEYVAPPTLPDNFRGFDVDSLPSAKIRNKKGDVLPYCP